MYPTAADSRGRPAHTVPAPVPFAPVPELAGLQTAVREFLDDPSAGSIPVWVGGRRDLVSSVNAANRLYAAIRHPEPVDCGILLGADELPEAVVDLVRPLARTW